MRVLKALSQLVVTIVVGGVVIGVCSAALVAAAGDTPKMVQFDSDRALRFPKLAERSTVYDTDGTLIGTLGDENRRAVDYAEIPKLLVDAVVATEDKTFWENPGVDVHAVARALLRNSAFGAVNQGGSTITQQLVKNRLLNSERTLRRKVQEVVLAWELSKRYSKRSIMEQYLNTVYFGQGSYGVASAVERMLARPDPDAPDAVDGVRRPDLDSVSLGEAALLAGVIASPESYNPFLHPTEAAARRAFVLDRMVQEGYASAEAAEAAKTEPLPSILPPPELRPSDAWVEEVQDRILTDARYSVLGATPSERKDALLRGGLKVYTTLDPAAQAAAEEAAAVPDRPPFTVALVSVEPTTGAVRAMVAGPDFATNQYNLVTSEPGRQAGSTWKTITLAAALAKRYSANDSVNGSSPCQFGELGQTSNAESGDGWMTVRSATAGSVNCAFARLELSVGFPDVMAMAQKLGITQKTLRPILTLTLGAIESTPLEMVTVASTIAAGGVRRDPYFIEKIVDTDGIVVYANDHVGLQTLDPEAAACEVSLLRGVVTGGTGTGASIPNWAVAGKTGTTDERADAWFLGMTPKLATVVWYGDPAERTPGAGFGGQVPASVFRSYMSSVLSDVEPEPWPDPPEWCFAPGTSLENRKAGKLPTAPTTTTLETPKPTVLIIPPTTPTTQGRTTTTTVTTPGPTTPPQTNPPGWVPPGKR